MPYRVQALQERRCTGIVENRVCGKYEVIGESFGISKLGAIRVGHVGYLLVAPAERGHVVRPVHAVSGLGVESVGPHSEQVRASSQFTQDSDELHCAARPVISEGLGLYARVEREPDRVRRVVDGSGRGTERDQIRYCPEAGATKVRGNNPCTPGQRL